MLVGYMRVSTAEQNLALQRDALGGAGCERLYEDICSGAVTDRPGLAKALDHLRTLLGCLKQNFSFSIPDTVATLGGLLLASGTFSPLFITGRDL